MPEGTDVLNPETLKDQKTPLSDFQFDAIEAEERKAREDEEKAEKEKVDKESGENSQEEDEEGAEDTEEEKAAKNKVAEDVEAKAKAEKAPESKPKEEEKPKEKTEDEKKAESEKAAQELETRAIEFAKEENVTIQEAKTELEHIQKQKDRFAGDPDKMAKTILHGQREYSKLQEDNKLLNERAETAERALSQRVIKVKTADGTEKEYDLRTEDGRAEWKVGIVESFRTDHQKETENLDDDEVFDLAQKKFNQFRTEKLRGAKRELSEKAGQRRVELIQSLPEADKKYSAEIEPLLNEYSDEVITHKDFSIADTVLWAKGKHYDEDIKAAEKAADERGFKRGQENAKIVGAGGTTGKNPPKSKGGFVNDLTEKEKATAFDMFEGQAMTDEEKFKEYRSLYKKGEA